MSDTRLQDREQYEESYDKITVELCREREQMVFNVFGEQPTLSPKASNEETGHYYQYSMFYFQLVESLAGERWQERQEAIGKWIAVGEKKDRRLAAARPDVTPYCRSCGEDMEIKLKSYLNRERGSAKKGEDDVLFMFRCVPCKTRMALWQDGTEWEGYQPHCEKCNAPVDETDTVTDNVITSTYTCGNCGHDYKNVWVLGAKTESPVDPHYKLDRRRFCFDAATGKKFLARKAHITHIGELLEQGGYSAGIDSETVGAVAEAVAAIKTLKIAQVADTLTKAVAKSGYTEFKLGEPQIGREVAVPFSCLDNRPERESYDSRMGLKKLITSTLADTNWRLATDERRCALPSRLPQWPPAGLRERRRATRAGRKAAQGQYTQEADSNAHARAVCTGRACRASAQKLSPGKAARDTGTRRAQSKPPHAHPAARGGTTATESQKEEVDSRPGSRKRHSPTLPRSPGH